MAGPVKGTIGQDEVTLNDAATETTLLKILAALKKAVEEAEVAETEPKVLKKTSWIWPKQLAKLPKS